MSLLCRGQVPAALFIALALFGSASAVAATVLLVPPETPSPAMAEAMIRVRGELASEGFTVEVVAAPMPPEPVLADAKTDAVVTILGTGVPHAVEIRMMDPATGKQVLRRLSLPSTTTVTAKALAIHTLERIRATFLEMDLAPSPRKPELPPSTVAASAPSPVRERFGIDVGATAVFDIDDSSPMVLPFLRLSWVLRPWLLPHLVSAGLGTHRTVIGDGMSAEVTQQFALAGASCRFRDPKRLRPFVSLSAGVLHTSAQGEAVSPAWAREARQWSLLVDASVGSWLAIGDRFQFAIALQVQVAEPYPAVRFSRSVVKTSRYPSLLVTMTLGTWL